MTPQTLPAYALPLFGTFSVASILGLVVLLLKFREDASKALVDIVMKSDKFQVLTGTFLTKEAARDTYVLRETYLESCSRLKYLEASCPQCPALKDAHQEKTT